MSQLKEALKKIDDMHKILTGNGHPEEGLVVKFDRVERFVKNIIRGIWIAATSAIAGVMVILWNIIKAHS